jgi:hypothetical protein
MFTAIKEHSNRSKNFKLRLITLGLQTQAEIDPNIAMNGLTSVQKAIPALTESDYDSKEKVFKLVNGQEGDRQIIFRLSRRTSFDLLWGPMADYGTPDQIATFFQTMRDAFAISSVNIKFIDLQVVLAAAIDINHYEVMMDVFYGGSRLFGVLPSNRIAFNDIRLRGYLDDATICVMKVSSDIADKEILSAQFSKDTLSVHAGIGRVKSLGPNERIEEAALTHCKLAIGFIESKFFTHIVFPLDEALSNYTKRKSEAS